MRILEKGSYHKLWLVAVCALLVLACEKKGVSVGKMWVRLPLQGKDVTAGYLVLANQSSQKMVLKSVTSPDFERVELHTMSMDQGIMKMQHLEQIEIEPRAILELKPHGKHLMMFSPKRKLKEGDTVQVTLHFESAPAMTLPLTVKKDY